jgi:hypothetical protein
MTSLRIALGSFLLVTLFVSISQAQVQRTLRIHVRQRREHTPVVAGAMILCKGYGPCKTTIG